LSVKSLAAHIEIARKLFVLAGCVGTLMIIVLSLVPVTLRPHTGAGGDIEHWIAYTLVALAFGLGFKLRRMRLLTGVALSAGSGLLELLQNFVPGRNPEVAGFLASSLGAWMGLGIAATLITIVGFAIEKKYPNA
jgi:VanZ family protein